MRTRTLIAVLLLAVTSACSAAPPATTAGRTELPDDPLEVVERLRTKATDDIVTWEMCSVDQSTTGAFSPAGRIGFVEQVTRQPTSAEPSGFQVEHVQRVGTGGEVLEQTRYERSLSNDSFLEWHEPWGYPAPGSPAPDALTTVDGLVDELRLEPTAGFMVPGSDPFLRFESLPVPVVGTDGRLQASRHIGLPEHRVVWTLDGWTDDAGTVERLRSMTSTGGWRELVFTAGEWRRPDLDRCPADPDQPGDDWKGRGGWETDLVVPLKVSLDPDGRPYDVAVEPGFTYDVESLT